MSNNPVFVPVPQECIRKIIGKGGRHIKQLQQESHTWIQACDGDNLRESGFTITGSPADCEAARAEILRRITPDVRKRISVPEKCIGSILGPRQKNKENLETKSGTKIKVIGPCQPSDDGNDTKDVILEIIGPEKNCATAESSIKSSIISYKESLEGKKLGGNIQFVCLDCVNKNEKYKFKNVGIAPKLDGFTQGQRYRVEAENGDYNERDFTDQTVSDLKGHLLSSLKKLHERKDEQQLMIDLWCHLGKVYVVNVDEVKAKETTTPAELNACLRKITSPSRKSDRKARWKASFEEGIDPSHVDDSKFPNHGVENNNFFDLKLVHTQWRYDYEFRTPTERSVRLKVWEGLPPDREEPPVEVKNILRPVDLEDEENIKAWLCQPSITVLRGEIMTPNSQYDCRVKLRAGPRNVSDKDVVNEEEDMALANYLSKCKFDRDTHDIHLPANEEHKIPDGFKCTFYRAAKERMFYAAVIDVNEDKECFTIIVLDEKGWDSDSSTKRDQKQFGIRVVKNSWSEVLLSPERNWEPEEILATFEQYMMFLSALKDYLFDD